MHFPFHNPLIFRKPQERQTEFGMRWTTSQVWLMKSWSFSLWSMESIQDQLLVSVTVFYSQIVFVNIDCPLWMSYVCRFVKVCVVLFVYASQPLHVRCTRRSSSSSWSSRRWRAACLNPRPPSRRPSPSKQMETRTATHIQPKISTATKKKVKQGWSVLKQVFPENKSCLSKRDRVKSALLREKKNTQLSWILLLHSQIM